MRRYTGIDMAYSKYADWAIFGSTVAPDLAAEVIRRTDVAFMSWRGVSPYLRETKRRLGIPIYEDRVTRTPQGGYDIDMGALHDDLGAFMAAWGCLTWPPDDHDKPHALDLMCNAMVSGGYGWCFPDGTIAMRDVVKRGYPSQIWMEADAVAAAFPDLDFSVAYWGAGDEAPSAGFIVRDGRAEGTGGTDPDLFARFGDVDYRNVRQVAEATGQAARMALPTASAFGSRSYDKIRMDSDVVRGVPDNIMKRWIERARSMGLGPS